MENATENKIAKLKGQRNNKNKFYIYLIVLALTIAIVSFIMAQPANTMSGEKVCNLKEHTHTEDCYEHKLICDQEEDKNHIHNEDCWNRVLVCLQVEHSHSEKCYDVKETKEIPVGNMEQEQSKQNADSIIEQLRKEIPVEYSEVRTAAFSENGTVYLFAKPDVIPKDVELKVDLIGDTSGLYEEAKQRIGDKKIVYDALTALDISLVDKTGIEIEPTVPVYVSIDFGDLLSEKVNPNTIEIQHHKEVLTKKDDRVLEGVTKHSSKNTKIVLDSVMNQEESKIIRNEEAGSYIATFPTESFSIYTITSSVWKDLKIKIQCVDEYGNELRKDHKPDDIYWEDTHNPNASFTKLFMSNKHDKIPGYEYDGKAYFMRNGEYERKIYGIRWENNAWYYYTDDNNHNSKRIFSEQPNFTVVDKQDPPDFIRVVYRKVTDIDVKYVDDAGIFGKKEIPLSEQDSPNGKNPDVIKYVGTELEIGNTDVMPKSNTYFFLGKAYVGEPTYDHQVVKVIREKGYPYGITLEGDKLLISKETPLKLIYRKVQQGKLEKANTVPTREKGMKINLFNYNTSINNGHKLQFRPQGTSEKAYNSWTGKDGGIYKGIVAENLVDGYPVVEGESLSYLFNPEICRQQLNTGQVKGVHTNLDRLFWRDKEGYYHYDSMTNFATVMPETMKEVGATTSSDGGNFIVYKQPALPGYNGTGDNAKFLPFDTYANANRPKEHNKPANKEYHFGMTMEADFTIPPGGKIPDAEGSHTGLRDMIFEFNGDDDVWVFIDDKLVLDLGGIHDRYGGKINFRTGEVVTNAPHTANSGSVQKNLYNIKEDPNEMTDAELKQAREDAGFGKFSQHTFKFFYLERGEGASNCEIRFNLVPVQHGLVVGKRIPEFMKDVATEHMWYQFKVETEFKGERKPLSNATYERIYWEPGADPIIGGQLLEPGKTDEEGRFWLRAGERADLAGAIDLKHTGVTDTNKMNIYVSEVLPDETAVPKVTAWSGKEEEEGTHMVVKDKITGKQRKLVPPLYDYKDDKISVELHTEKTKTAIQQVNIDGTGEKAYQAVLKTGRHNEFNWIDFENDMGNLAGLNISKQAHRSDGKPISDVPFAIKVELWDTKAKDWIPLPVGTEYWILNDKVVKPGEKLPENEKLHLDKSADGLISIKHGQSIHLHVLPGTKYRVSEVLTLEDKAVYATTYKGESSVAGEEFVNKAGDGIENKAGIKAGTQHYVTINNTGNPIVMPKGSFVLMKKVQGIIPSNEKFQFNLQIKDHISEKTEISCNAMYYRNPTGSHPQGKEETIVFKKENGSGIYKADLSLYPDQIVVIQGLPKGKALEIKELLEAGKEDYYDVSFEEEGKQQVNSKSIVTSLIDSQRVVKVLCLNQSNIKDHSTLSISKEVKRTDQPDGNPLEADRERSFPFEVSIKKPGAISLDNILAKKTLANGQISYFKLKFNPKGEDYVTNVNLKHGETIVISELPVDVDVLVKETDHDGYSAFMNGVPGDQTTVKLGFNTGAPYEVKCVNMTGVELPETGGNGVIPYFLIGTVMMLSAVALFLISFRRERG